MRHVKARTYKAKAKDLASNIHMFLKQLLANVADTHACPDYFTFPSPRSVDVEQSCSPSYALSLFLCYPIPIRKMFRT